VGDSSLCASGLQLRVGPTVCFLAGSCGQGLWAAVLLMDLDGLFAIVGCWEMARDCLVSLSAFAVTEWDGWRQR
jgi:hypothetical protein